MSKRFPFTKRSLEALPPMTLTEKAVTQNRVMLIASAEASGQQETTHIFST